MQAGAALGADGVAAAAGAAAASAAHPGGPDGQFDGGHEGHAAPAGAGGHLAHSGGGAAGGALDPANPEQDPSRAHGGPGERVTTLAGARGGGGGGARGAEKGRVRVRVGSGRALLWGAPLLAVAALVALGLWRMAGPSPPAYEALRSKAHASPVLPHTRLVHPRQ